MEIIALAIGYFIIAFLGLIALYAFIQWLLYGQVGESISQTVTGNKIYVNGRFIKETNGGNISMINGSVYENGKCIYKHKKKFRWEK